MNGNHKCYFHGKNLKKTDGNVPTKGDPNSFIDVRHKDTGKMKRRRKIGNDGLATKDIDMGQGRIKNIHVHLFNKNGSRNTKHIDASKSEIREMQKANRKRRTKL